MDFQIEDLRLHYEVFGPEEAQPILILHGWSGHLATMTAVFEPIFSGKNEYRRFYLDLPGCGDSGASDAFTSSDAVLQALLAFADNVIGKSFLLAGYSYGGYLARAMVAKGAQVSGLLLLAPMVVPDRAKRILPKTDWFLKLPATQIAQRKYNTVWKEPNQAYLSKLRESYALSWDTSKVPVFEKPALILLGQQDTTVGFQQQLTMLAHYPRATWAVLDLAGHNLAQEQDGLFAALTRDWLARCEF